LSTSEQSPNPPNTATTYAIGTGRRLRRAVSAFSLLLLIGFMATAFIRTQEAHHLANSAELVATTPPLVKIITVGPAVNGPSIVLPGETAAWYQSTIYGRVSGYVGQWSADIGDHVKKGQVLATIETPELDASLAAAQAQANASQAQVKVWEARVDFAKSSFQRWHDAPKGVVSDQEREDKRANQAAAIAELAAATAKAKLDQAEVRRLEAFEQFKAVTAPFAGVITERHIDIGNLVTAGSTTNTTPLYRLAEDDQLRIFVDVPQTLQGERMKPGSPASILTENGPATPIEGKIARTSGAISPRSRTFRVEVDIANPAGLLTPGLYVRVAFQSQTSLPEVPAAALLFQGAEPLVAVIMPDQTISLRPVTIAQDNGAMVALASGVSPGDRLALNLSSQIADGSKVRLQADGPRTAP